MNPTYPWHVPQNTVQIGHPSLEAGGKTFRIDGHKALAQIGFRVGAGVCPFANLGGVVGSGHDAAEYFYHRGQTVSLVSGGQFGAAQRH